MQIRISKEKAEATSVVPVLEVNLAQPRLCSKCGETKPLSEFHKNGFSSNGQQKYRGYCKVCANALETDRYWQKREYIDEQRLPCVRCGEDDPDVIDFHHRDPEAKDFTIGKMKKGDIKVIQAEIDKCVCFCSNCHRKWHARSKRNPALTLEEFISSK